MRKTLQLTLTALVAFILTGAFAEDKTSEQLNALSNKFESTASEKKKADFQKGIDYIINSGILNEAIQNGQIAPDFELENALGNEVTLTDLLSKGPVILVWYRGGWCPYCNIYLRALQQRLPEIKQAGAQLVAISPELPSNALSTKQKHHLDFNVLSDVGNQVAFRYGVVFKLPDYVIKHYDLSFSLPEYNGDNSYTLPLAATYVIDVDRKVRYAYLDADYRRRAPIDILINVINSI